MRKILSTELTPKINSGIQWTELLFCALLCFAEVQGVVGHFIRMFIPNTYKIDTLIMYGLLIFIILKASPNIIRHIRYSEVNAILVVIILFLLSSLSRSFRISILNSMLLDILLFCIPAYFAAISIQNTKELHKKLYYVGYIMLICDTLLMFVFKTYLADVDHSLSGGYAIVIAIVLIVCFHRSKIDIFFILFAFVLMLSAGSRGPLLTIVLFLIIYFLFLHQGKRRKAISIISITLISIVIYVFYNDVINMLTNIIDSWGLSSRVLVRIIESNVATDNNRNMLYEYAFRYIKDHLFWGSGLINDRVVIYNNFGWMFFGIPLEGAYIHNIFLELMIQFGGVVGLILSLYIIIQIIKMLFINKDRDNQLLFLMVLSCGLFPLLVSFSYLSYVYFYLFIGIIVNTNRTRCGMKLK